jgi:hypothetical protein
MMRIKKVLNYRKIIEKQLGRKLRSDEIIHHIDGNEHNNEPENYEILTSRKEHRLKKRIKPIIDECFYEQAMQQLDKISIESFKNDLKQIFTDRQIQILFRRLNKQILSKTESEMYSREIKKKLKALANNQLFEIANQMIGD